MTSIRDVTVESGTVEISGGTLDLISEHPYFGLGDAAGSLLIDTAAGAEVRFDTGTLRVDGLQIGGEGGLRGTAVDPSTAMS